MESKIKLKHGIEEVYKWFTKNKFKKCKVAIIGAGISGISASKLLHEKGIKSTVFEASDKIGGLVS